ncbi:cysteine desulfurase SufS [Pantoea sp. Nvir]|uniref:cysteine desulfurase SufS n=1 Tax=Pantoea sp. Nvir TaxID=2576760 RepID=UPI001357DB5E|nr:cysteine desulfurase SufS [Pantoea sp. Nvir]MXP66203.1 cysteine desulfurase SufS [Pantoea sp. Nvir]
MNFNLNRIRADFPILKRNVNGHPLAYLDSAASSQRPLAVINAENHFYQYSYASVHRGIHSMSVQATNDLENVRLQAARFLNASSSEEIVFVKSTTEGINLVANSWGGSQLKAGDNLIITEMEHHANIVPWQMLVQRIGAELRVLPLNDNGELAIAKLDRLIDNRTRLFAVTHVSNVLGTVNPVQALVAQAKAAGLVTLVDGAQAVMHSRVDVREIDCDFYVFSSHKIYGPNSVGILYGRKVLLDDMPPWEGGGSMIEHVMLPNGTTWNKSPWRFEAGTPNTGGIIGFGAALRYVEEISFDVIQQYEQVLMNYALEKLSSVPDITIYGPQDRVGVISFNLGKYHAYDVGSFLDQYGIAIRTGHHCAMPLMHHYAVPAMCRASFAFYNSKEEIDRLAAGLTRIHCLLGG